MSDLIKTADTLTIHLDERLLPGVVRDIANLIGLHAALKAVEHYQGIRMWVPVRFDPEHILVKQLGHDAAVKLIENFPGEKLEIPRCLAAIRAVRNAKICASDKSQRQLAMEHGLTERHVRNIQNGVEDDDGQEELF